MEILDVVMIYHTKIVRFHYFPRKPLLFALKGRRARTVGTGVTTCAYGPRRHRLASG